VVIKETWIQLPATCVAWSYVELFPELRRLVFVAYTHAFLRCSRQPSLITGRFKLSLLARLASEPTDDAVDTFAGERRCNRSSETWSQQLSTSDVRLRPLQAIRQKRPSLGGRWEICVLDESPPKTPDGAGTAPDRPGEEGLRGAFAFAIQRTTANNCPCRRRGLPEMPSDPSHDFRRLGHAAQCSGAAASKIPHQRRRFACCRLPRLVVCFRVPHSANQQTSSSANVRLNRKSEPDLHGTFANSEKNKSHVIPLLPDTACMASPISFVAINQK
jgi:hypothetical protein